MGLITVFHYEFNMKIKNRYYQTYSQPFQLFNHITLVTGDPIDFIPIKVTCQAMALLFGDQYPFSNSKWLKRIFQVQAVLSHHTGASCSTVSNSKRAFNNLLHIHFFSSQIAPVKLNRTSLDSWQTWTEYFMICAVVRVCWHFLISIYIGAFFSWHDIIVAVIQERYPKHLHCGAFLWFAPVE